LAKVITLSYLGDILNAKVIDTPKCREMTGVTFIGSELPLCESFNGILKQDTNLPVCKRLVVGFGSETFRAPNCEFLVVKYGKSNLEISDTVKTIICSKETAIALPESGEFTWEPEVDAYSKDLLRGTRIPKPIKHSEKALIDKARFVPIKYPVNYWFEVPHNPIKDDYPGFAKSEKTDDMQPFVIKITDRTMAHHPMPVAYMETKTQYGRQYMRLVTYDVTDLKFYLLQFRSGPTVYVSYESADIMRKDVGNYERESIGPLNAAEYTINGLNIIVIDEIIIDKEKRAKELEEAVKRMNQYQVKKANGELSESSSSDSDSGF
jgi:hypothetical protein